MGVAARSARSAGTGSSDTTRDDPTATAFDVLVSPRTVLRVLLGAVAGLTAMSVAGQVLLREAPGLPLRGGLAHALYVDSEQSLPTLFAVLLILAAALLMSLIAAAHRRLRSRDTWCWASASGLAFLLALDEYLSLHEQLIEPLRELLGGDEAPALLYYAWVVPGVVAVAVVTAVFVPFLRRLPERSRKQFLLSAALYLSGAIGMEMVGGAIDSSAGDREGYAYVAVTTAEEALEMVAVALLLYALLDYVSRNLGALRLRAAVAEQG